MQSNPFLDDTINPRWADMDPRLLDEALELSLAEAEAQIAEIRQADERGLSFDNTFLALEHCGMQLERAWNYSDTLNSVSNSKALREVREKWLPKITQHETRIFLDSALYRKFSRCHDQEDAKRQNPVRQRFMRETLMDFEEAGAHLDSGHKELLEDIESELSSLTQKFSDQTLDATNAFSLVIEDEKELAGLPASAIAAALDDAEKQGIGSPENPVWRFTLHAPSLVPVLRYADSDALRKRIYEAFVAVGGTDPLDNAPVLKRILALRRQKATLIGRAHFPDLVLARRMAKNAKNALEFVEDLHRRTLPKFKEENRELEEFRAARTGERVRPLHPWEAGYWSEKLRREQYDFDEEELRPYFAVDQVLSGMFNIAAQLFDIRITGRKENRPPVWHDEVNFFDMHDAKDGRHLGSFYTDWHPRPSKRSGAWMADIRVGCREPGKERTPHLGMICGNMTRAIGKEPSQLTHDEVTTVFHEFGHLLHGLLGEVEIPSMNGVHVAWDFVELPSQLIENWCWERESLDLFARHWKTGAPIPDHLFRKMRAARNFQAARMQMRQLSFAKLDLEMHLDPDPFIHGDLDAEIIRVLQGYIPPLPEPYRSTVRQFGHLFDNPTGYAAGYYSYKWAEVLEADAFSRFKIEGLMSRKTGMDFREHILSQGNSRDPAELYRRFMGRDPDPAALLRQLGLEER